MIDIDSINIDQYLDEDCQLDRGKLVLGNLVRISHSKFNIDIYAKIIELNFDFENNGCKLTISNIEAFNKEFDKFLQKLNQAVSTSTTVDINKTKWNLGESANNQVNNILQNAWDAGLREIQVGNGEKVNINERGITLTNPDDSLKAIRMMHDIIGCTLDGFNTLGVAISPEGVHAERLIGRIIAGEDLTITTNNGDFLVNSQGVTINKLNLTLTRDSNTSRLIQNATDGIKIQKSIDNGVNWTDQLYADINGDLNIVGKLQAGSIISNTTISGGTISIGSGNSIFKADQLGIYLGNTNYSSAPFRVSPGGVLTATNANITGNIDCSSLKINGENVLTGGQIDGGFVEGSTIQNLNANNITAGIINANRINTSGLFAEKIYKPNSPNNYAIIGGTYCDFKLYNSSGNYFTIYDSTAGAGAFFDNVGSFLSFGNRHTRPQGSWDFSDCTEVKGVVAKFG
jgi:hypothetical protein